MSSKQSSRDDRSVCAGAYEGLGSLWVIAVATYIQQKYKQKQVTHDRSSVIWQKITQNVNALKVVDRIDLTKFKNMRTWQTGLLSMPHYVRTTSAIKRVPCFCVKYRWNLAPPRDVFLTASARAYQKHVLHAPETVSIFILSLISWNKDDITNLCYISLL